MKETVKRNLGSLVPNSCLSLGNLVPNSTHQRKTGLKQGLETETNQFHPPWFNSFPGGGKGRLYLIVDFVVG